MMSLSYYISEFFKIKVRLIVKRPLPFLLFPFVVTIGSIVLAINSDIHNRSSIQIFLPQNLEAFSHVKTIQKLFIQQEDIRDDYYIFNKKVAYFIIEDLTQKGNVLRQEVVSTVSEVHNMVMGIKTKGGNSYTDLCLQKNGICYQHPINILLGQSAAFLSTKLLARYPFITIGDVNIDNTVIFGNAKLNYSNIDSKGNAPIVKASAVRILYLLNVTNNESDEWMGQFDALLNSLNLTNINLFFTTSNSFGVEIAKNGDILIPYIPWMALLLIIVTSIFCLHSNHTQVIFGLAALLNATFAVITTVCLFIAIGFPFIEIIYIIPFLMMSIGTDNMFLMLKSWQNQVDLHGYDKISIDTMISEAIGEIGVALFMTSLTDSVSYLIGSISSFYVIHVFCSYCAFSIIFMFLYQSTFLTAVMIMTNKKEAATNKNSQLFDTAINVNFSKIYKKAMNKYTDLLQKTHSHLVVLFIFISYLLLSCYAILNIKIGVNMKTITSLGCPVSKEMFASERLFSDYGLYTYAVINVTSTNLTYLGERKKLTDLYSEMSATDLVSPVGFVFNGFNRAFPYDFPTEKLFNEVLDLVLMRSKFKKYKSDLSYNEKNRITFIKMVFRIRHGEENNSYARSNHFENVLAKSNYKGFIFDNDYFKLEQEKQTISVSISNTIMATITITLISALLIPKIKTIICITTTVFSINIGVVATLSLMGIRLDIISMITMLMSIGYSVDYATHVAFHFLIQKEQCLQFITLPLLQASITTIVGIILLIRIDSYIIQTFVLTVIGVVFIGLLHSLLFLPVALNIFVGKTEVLNISSHSMFHRPPQIEPSNSEISKLDIINAYNYSKNLTLQK